MKSNAVYSRAPGTRVVPHAESEYVGAASAGLRAERRVRVTRVQTFPVSFTGTGSQHRWLPPGLAGEPLSHLVLLRGEYEMSKAEKKNLRYCDYYWCMSLKDFTEWVEADDGFEPAMSFADIP